MRLALVAISVALETTSGCAGESPNRATPVIIAAEPSPSASAPPASASASASASPSSAPSAAAPARPKSCAEDFPNADMIRDNIADTSVTGIAEVVATTQIPSPKGISGYVNNHYELKVSKWLSGKGSEKQVLSQGAEEDFEPYAPGTLLFFSACMTKDGAMSEPDVGRVFPIDPACRAEVEKMGEVAAKRATAAGKRKKACAKTK